MTPEKWRRVRDLFEAAVDEQPSNLAAWLDGQAIDDHAVREEVISLVLHHRSAHAFLSEPIVERLPHLLAADDALPAGTVIGPYTIVREIGRGGMGRVYLANDERLQRTVALKALPPDVTRDELGRERLRREAQTAAALMHAGICTVYALEEIDGDLFIASEFIDGHTLREEIGSGRRPSPDQVLMTARALAAALAAAHRHGVVHRDLKPENIMRTRDGRLKILDFGVARAADGFAPAVRRVTQPGAVVGTPAYMAPEQLRGESVDARADVFALGVVLYEYASGVHPFDSTSALGLVARVLETEPIPIDERRPGLAPGLVAVVERSLCKSPADRFASAVEIVPALGQHRQAATGRRARHWWLTHQVVVMALYVVGATTAWRIKEFFNTPFALAMFVAIGVCAAIAGIVRGHLIFTNWMNPVSLDEERQKTAQLLTVVDLLIAVTLVIEGLLLSSARAIFGVLTVALGIGIGLAAVLMEPATTKAAFRR